MKNNQRHGQLHNYELALKEQNFSPLTISSYVSAANRYLDYLSGTIKK